MPRRPWPSPLAAAGGSVAAAAVAFAALGYLHQAVEPGATVACAVVAVGTTAAVRTTWSGLPDYVTAWLDAGVLFTVALVAVLATGPTRGAAYLLFHWKEVAALAAVAALAGTATATLAYTHQRLALEVQAQADRLAALQQRALESRLSALSAQINPHFLFNTLNTLAEVVHEDEDLAEDLIVDLAGMMRHALRSSTSRVPLADELDVIRRLLRLEAARLGERLTFTVEADPDVASVPIPGLLVQPLVENAVRHGIAPRSEPGRVDVRAERVGDHVRITVSDDGPGLSAEAEAALGDADPAAATGTAGAGGGLRNCAERVRLAWPARAASLIREPTSTGTRLVMTFPAEDP